MTSWYCDYGCQHVVRYTPGNIYWPSEAAWTVSDCNNARRYVMQEYIYIYIYIYSLIQRQPNAFDSEFARRDTKTCDIDSVLYTPQIYLDVLLSIFAYQMCLFDSNVSIYIIASFLFFQIHLLFRWYFFAFGFNAKIHILFTQIFMAMVSMLFMSLPLIPVRANQTQREPESQSHWFSIQHHVTYRLGKQWGFIPMHDWSRSPGTGHMANDLMMIIR